jgi:hypothetical protein
MKPIVWTLLLTGVALNAAAQLLLKAATRYVGPLVSDSGGIDWLHAAAIWKAPPLWVGLGCYGISVLLWLGALSRLPVSVAYPRLRRQRSGSGDALRRGDYRHEADRHSADRHWRDRAIARRVNRLNSPAPPVSVADRARCVGDSHDGERTFGCWCRRAAPRRSTPAATAPRPAQSYRRQAVRLRARARGATSPDRRARAQRHSHAVSSLQAVCNTSSRVSSGRASRPPVLHRAAR